MTPAISVILTSHGRPALLPKALDSIRKQSFRDWELVVIDDGNTPQNRLLLDGVAQKDKRVRVFYQDYANVSLSANRGLKEARGDWISFQDDDDYSHRARLALCWRALQDAPHRDGVFPMVQVFYDGTGRKQEQRKFFTHLKQALLKRSLVEKLGGFRPLFPIAEDTDLYLRLEDSGAKFTYLSKVVYYYRQYNAPTHLSHRLDRAQYHLAARLAQWCRQNKQPDPLDNNGTLNDMFAFLPTMPATERQKVMERALLSTYRWQLELAWQNDDAERTKSVLAEAQETIKKCKLPAQEGERFLQGLQALSGSWSAMLGDFIVHLGEIYQEENGKEIPPSTTAEALFQQCRAITAEKRDWLLRKFLLKSCKQRGFQSLTQGHFALLGRVIKDVRFMTNAMGYTPQQQKRIARKFFLSVVVHSLRYPILRR